MSTFGLVALLPVTSGEYCVYCDTPNTDIVSGALWVFSMGVRDYQNLIDRGWMRSNGFMRKPCMKRTCCPAYAIRCDVGALVMSKSQKKVLKKFYNYLRFGDTSREFHSGAGGDGALVDGRSSCIKSKSKMTDDDKKCSDERSEDPNVLSTSLGKRGTQGESESQHRQRKAKLIRLENKYKKLRSRGMTEEEATRLTYESKKTSPQKEALSFEDYFPQPEDVSNYAHKFRIDLHSVAYLKEDKALLQESYKLYSKYQMAVHGDKRDDCTMDEFENFYMDSPLCDPKLTQGPPSGFGTFHQHYWLDERLIAVGVIDILPKCVSSVYFFYDPDLRSLALGTYGALYEIYFTRGLMQVCPTIKYYDMGFYVHSCPKMNYKRRYYPSYLLCPETFTWHRIEKCCLMLEKNKYSRFEEDPNVIDKFQCDVDLSKVMIYYKYKPIDFLRYKYLVAEAVEDNEDDGDNEEKIINYAKLVGEDCYQNILLFRS